MSTEQEQRNKLEELYHSWKNMAGVYFGEFMVVNGVTVDLPPEPQWKPGQYAWVDHEGELVLVRRNHRQTLPWDVVNDGSRLRDDEVTDVEPVAVLTAEDVRTLIDRLSYPLASNSDAIAFFAERGVDVR